MKNFPMFLNLAGRRVVIIGGGEQAAQKARLLLKTQAELVLVAPALDPELGTLVESGRACLGDPADPALFRNAPLVFVATGCCTGDVEWHRRAKAAGTLVNVVDRPDLCDAMTPSIVDRDPVVVAIGTEGTAPVLGRRIKAQVEQMLHQRLGDYAALAGRLRAEVAERIAPPRRRDFWHWVFAGAPWNAFGAGREREAIRQIKDCIASGSQAQGGRLTVVLDAHDPGLIPVAAMQRLQEADVIFLDRDVPDSILELARRDAERVLLQPPDPGLFPPAIQRLLENASLTQRAVYLTRRDTALDLVGAMADRHPVEQICAARFIAAPATQPVAAALSA